MDSGDYAIADTALAAADALRERRPAPDVWAVRVGYPTLRTFGGSSLLWDSGPRHIEADAVGSTPLVGMSMLDSHNLNIEVVDGGSVVIQARE